MNTFYHAVYICLLEKRLSTHAARENFNLLNRTCAHEKTEAITQSFQTPVGRNMAISEY